MARMRALQPAHKSTKVTVTAATQAFKKLQKPADRARVVEDAAASKPVHPGKPKSRLSKRGFTPLDRTQYQVVNLYQLDALEVGGPVTPDTLKEHGLIRHAEGPVRVLGAGELTRRLDVAAHKFSQAARDKIVAAGGVVHEL